MAPNLFTSAMKATRNVNRPTNTNGLWPARAKNAAATMKYNVMLAASVGARVAGSYL